MDKGSECLVRGTSLSPGVSTTCEIDENDTESPDVVSLGIVFLYSLKQATLAFG